MAETPPFTPSPTDPTHTGEYCIEKFSDIFDELYEYIGPTAAKGAMASLAERIAVSMNTDGTLKTSVTTGEWLSIDTSLYTYGGATSFTITGDYTAHFPTGRKVKFTNASGTITYGNVVVASVYTATTGVIVTGGAISSPSYLSLGMGPYSMPDRIYTPGGSSYISAPTVTSDDEFVTLAASQTLTNKTLTSAYLTAPSITSLTLASATLSSPVIDGGTISTPTISNPDVSSGTFASATMSTPTLVNAILSGSATADLVEFGSYPTVPATAPTASSEVSPKAYVDEQIAAIGGGGGVSWGPNGAMCYWRGGLTTAPSYMVVGGTVSGTSAADTSEFGYKAILTNASGSVGYIGWRMSSNGFTTTNGFCDLSRWQGQDIEIHAKVNASTASRVHVHLYDGTTDFYSGYHSGGSSFETLTKSATMASTMSDFYAEVVIDSGSSISVEVELLCFGPSCSDWTPYVSRNRKFQACGSKGSSGNLSFTGCPFSPIYYTAVASYSSATGGGGAQLTGATTTQAAANIDEAVTTKCCGASNTKYAAHYSWDLAGATITCTVNDTTYFTVAMFEGNPI